MIAQEQSAAAYLRLDDGRLHSHYEVVDPPLLEGWRRRRRELLCSFVVVLKRSKRSFDRVDTALIVVVEVAVVRQRRHEPVKGVNDSVECRRAAALAFESKGALGLDRASVRVSAGATEVSEGVRVELDTGRNVLADLILDLLAQSSLVAVGVNLAT